jgi:hypothetical protein
MKMNYEIKRLQYEINKLRKQNLEKQRQIRYVPLNIISNNLYINNSLNNGIPIKTNTNKNTKFNSLLKKKNNLSNSSSTVNYKNKKNKSYARLPFKKGMFSYKNSLMISAPNNNYKNMNNISSNRINYKYNNNSLLSANLKLNLDNDDNDNNLSQNNIIHGRYSSSSSFDLNKYKITEKSMNNIIKGKNTSLSNLSYKNINKNGNLLNNSNVYNKDNNKKHNSVINNFNNNNLINNNINSNIKTNNNINNKLTHNSFDNSKISPIVPKLMSNKDNTSPSLIIIDDYKENNNNSSKNLHKKRKIFDHFRDKPDNEKESRRMIVELIKVFKRKYNKNSNDYDVNTVLLKNNISQKVLNKEIIAKEFNSSNIFNNFLNTAKNNKNNIEVNSVQTSSNISLLNNFNNSVVNINNKVMSKNFNSPIKTNINNFLTNMNDEKRDKINMIKFLSKPRTMNVYFQQKKYTYLFFLSPNNLSYINAIETYIFKFVDMKNRKPIGGFDLIKVDLCSLNNNNPNFFYVRTNDGKIQRNYEFEASSQENAIRYVQSINYLVQLEKCKIYNNKNIFL